MEPVAGGFERVVLPQSGLPYADEAGATQIREMTRHGSLRGPENRDKIADAYLAMVLQQVKDPEARAIGESTEHPVYSCCGHKRIVDLRKVSPRTKSRRSSFLLEAWA